jgi:adenylyltransferase/sulfurtransferase
VVPGVVGALQATEALKLAAGFGEPLVGRLLVFDAFDLSFRTLKVRRDPNCRACGDAPTITALQDDEAFCGTAAPAEVPELTPRALYERLSKKEPVQLVDVREPGEREINLIAGSVLIPLGELTARYTELRTDADVVVYCKVGERSARAVAELQRIGFTRVFNLAGGIERWAEDVDEDLPSY